MKNKLPLFLFLGLLAINLLSNSCKKDKETNVPNLLVGGVWQLASIQVFNYVGDSQLSTDTLNDSCLLTQIMTFNKDKTVSYTNFDCLPQTSTGTWTLTENNLYFASDLVAKDTTKVGTATPFDNTQIETLGNYSMVLQTGDVAPNYSSTKRRRVVRYGFVRQKAAPDSI